MKKRLIAMALCLLMLVGFLPLTTAEAANAEDEPMRFVMVLDCSDSMREQDKHFLCAKSCEIFLDMMSEGDARVGVVGMGVAEESRYGDNNKPYPVEDHRAYDFGGTAKDKALETLKQDGFSRDAGHILLLQELENADVVQEKGIQATIESTVNAKGARTPVGLGLLAAYDMLETDKTPDGRGAIILVTDGRTSSSANRENEKTLAEQVARDAGSHQWQVYTVQLHGNPNDDRDSENTADMKMWAQLSGGKQNSYNDLTGDMLKSTTEVTRIFLEIFNTYLKGEGVEVGPDNGMTDIKTDAAGNGHAEFEVPILTSQTKIMVTGEGITSLVLTPPAGGGDPIVVDRSIGKSGVDKVIAKYHQGSFIAVTLLVPFSGIWQVDVVGGANVEILQYQYSIKDLELVLKPTVETTEFSKTQSLTVNATYKYHSFEIPYNDKVYEVKVPAIEITNNNIPQDVPVEFTQSTYGYTATVKMRDLGTGTFKLAAVLTESTATLKSNTITFSVENQESGITDYVLPNRDAYVHKGFDDFERIDLVGRIDNPDGDELIFVVESAGGRDIREDPSCNGIDYKIEDGYLYLAAGDLEGSYQINVGYREDDVEAFAYFNPFTFTVTQREFSYTAPVNVELWCDEYPWYKDVATPQPKSAELDLTDSYSDPDGDELIISDVKVKITPANDKVEEVLDWDYDEKTGELTIDSLGEGTGVVSYTVSDGYTEEDITFSIKVVSGKARFWAKNWIWFVITAGVIFVICFIAIILNGITKVKGEWDIQFQYKNHEYTMNSVSIGGMLQIGRKKKFKLVHMIDELRDFVDIAADKYHIMEKVPLFFGSAPSAEKIMLQGVTFGTGFIVDKIPANDGTVSVEINGIQVTKKAKVSGGEFDLIMTRDGGYGSTEELRIVITPAQPI